jgi:hypothetical protein
MVYVIDVWRLCFFLSEDHFEYSQWNLGTWTCRFFNREPLHVSSRRGMVQEKAYNPWDDIKKQERWPPRTRVAVSSNEAIFRKSQKMSSRMFPINFNFGGISNCHVWSTKSISVDMCVCNYLWMLVWLFLEDPLKRCGSHSREEHRCRETLVFGSPFANSGGDPSRENAIFQSIPYIKGGATKCKIF